jgi:hypothetical protein
MPAREWSRKHPPNGLRKVAARYPPQTRPRLVSIPCPSCEASLVPMPIALYRCKCVSLNENIEFELRFATTAGQTSALSLSHRAGVHDAGSRGMQARIGLRAPRGTWCRCPPRRMTARCDLRLHLCDLSLRSSNRHRQSMPLPSQKQVARCHAAGARAS